MNQQQVIAGRFRIETLIQRGGMGDVYRGTDLETEQTIAVKTLNRDMLQEDPLLLERFRREADVLRRLNHPNIVRILATVDEDSGHHIVMEYMPGGSLGDLIDRDGKLPLDRSVHIALDLSDALTRAHRLQIIHRDVKPAHVLLAADGTPRLTDFGVAQMADRQTRLTRQGALLGTVAYLAPELCTGEPYSEKSDIWAFGVVLYEMLAGRRPFGGERPAEVVGAIMNDPVSDLDRYRGDVPTRLNALILRMLAKQPAERWDSVRAVGTELEEISRDLNAAPVEKAPETPRPKVVAPPLSPSVTLEAARPRTTSEPRIYLSYRRSDADAFVAELAPRLENLFGHENVVRDVDRLNLRTASRLVLINEVLGTCTHAVIVIGPKWRGNEQLNLDSARDPVRIELEAALKMSGLTLLPLLVDGATMPRAQELPTSLVALAGLSPAFSGGDFEAGLRQLAAIIRGSPAQRRAWLWPALAAASVILIVLLLVLTRA
ncbi:MAG: serine/threonine protein kinase [Anaerolineae bacterium]|nr:serine/threonine protein kinase [Anaerolineae bacterium]